MRAVTAPVITDLWWLIGRAVLVPIARGAMRLRRSGNKHLPRDGATLVVANHVSQRDPPLIGVAALPRRLHYMAKVELFRVPLLSRFISRLGAFPVDRGAADRDAIRVSREILRRGDALLMFPEGTRTRSGRMRPGLPGAGMLALEPGVTVVPAVVWGSQRLLGPVRIAFGPPIDMSRLGNGSRAERAKRAVELIMATLAEMLPQVGGPRQNPPGHA